MALKVTLIIRIIATTVAKHVTKIIRTFCQCDGHLPHSKLPLLVMLCLHCEHNIPS